MASVKYPPELVQKCIDMLEANKIDEDGVRQRYGISANFLYQKLQPYKKRKQAEKEKMYKKKYGAKV